MARHQKTLQGQLLPRQGIQQLSMLREMVSLRKKWQLLLALTSQTRKMSHLSQLVSQGTVQHSLTTHRMSCVHELSFASYRRTTTMLPTLLEKPDFGEFPR